MSEPVNVEWLLNLVRASCETGGAIAMGRIKGQWLEIFEEADEVYLAYWVREQPGTRLGYEVVEIDLADPDTMDLEIASNFPA